MIKDMLLDSAVFSNIRVLDLSDNEIGDIGLGHVMKLFLSKRCSMNEVFTDRNGITDKGFDEVMKALPVIHGECCPSLTFLSMTGNRITQKCRSQYLPYPSYINV